MIAMSGRVARTILSGRAPIRAGCGTPVPRWRRAALLALSAALVAPAQAGSVPSAAALFRTSDAVVVGWAIFPDDRPTEGILRPWCVLKGRKREQYHLVVERAPEVETETDDLPRWRPLREKISGKFYLTRLSSGKYSVSRVEEGDV